jgi:hypothetical protein
MPNENTLALVLPLGSVYIRITLTNYVLSNPSAGKCLVHLIGYKGTTFS